MNMFYIVILRVGLRVQSKLQGKYRPDEVVDHDDKNGQAKQKEITEDESYLDHEPDVNIEHKKFPSIEKRIDNKCIERAEVYCKPLVFDSGKPTKM